MKNFSSILLNIIQRCPFYPVTFVIDKVCHINRWLVTSSIIEDSLFCVEPRFNQEARIYYQGIEKDGKWNNEDNWRYYISDDKSSLFIRNSADSLFERKTTNTGEKIIYYLSSVYCYKREELLIHIATMIPWPIKVWINGSLVMMGTKESFSKNAIISFVFNKGLNTILVEKPMFASQRRFIMAPKFFSLSIRTKQSVTNIGLGRAINVQEQLRQHLTRSMICTDKIFYKCGDTIRICIFNHHSKLDTYSISLIDSSGSVKHEGKGRFGEIICISVYSDYRFGVYKLIINSENTRYIFIGDYDEYSVKSIDILKKRRLSVDMIKNLSYNYLFMNPQKSTINGSIELMHDTYSQLIFDKIYRCEEYISDQISDSRFLWPGYNIFESRIDGGEIPYLIEIPSTYTDQKKYALIVYLTFDDCHTGIPMKPNRILEGKVDTCISLTVIGRADNTGDYLFEIDVINLIEYIISRFSVDIEQIYLLGLCTGARRGDQFYRKYPTLFASILLFAGSNIDCTSDTDIARGMIQVCNIDDCYYNGAMIIKKIKNDLHNNYLVSKFGHEELLDYYSNAYTQSLFKGKKNEYDCSHIIPPPKNIESIKDIYTSFHYLLTNVGNPRLLFLLDKPFAKCERNYRFPRFMDGDSVNLLSENHIIVCIDMESQTDEHNPIYSYAKNKDSVRGIMEDGLIVELCNNPLNNDKKMLIIAYTGHDAENKLISIWTDINCLPENETILLF